MQWPFHGGLSLNRHKSPSAQHPIQTVPLPDYLVLPLQQHIGQAAKPCVAVGDYVAKGQLIAQADGPVSAAVHASSSGHVVAIEARPLAHPSGLNVRCIIVQTDGQDHWLSPPSPTENVLSQAPEKLRQDLADKGIVGLGGATFPTHLKLAPGPQTNIDTLIINAAECEPYITCDNVLIQHHAAHILYGAVIMRRILGVKHIIIGIEADMQVAFTALTDALQDAGHQHLQIQAVPSLYPTGGEKQLIKVLTNREVPSSGLPAQIGLICHNVGTAYAVYQAIVNNTPLISRLVTVTGSGIQPNGNIDTLIGTPIEHLLKHAGDRLEGSQIIVGGPMMGFVLPTTQAPVTKGVNCLLLHTPPATTNALPCIRCAKCADVCPIKLLPQQLYWYAKAKNMDAVQNYHLFDCIECGCCAYVCPSQIPLVQYYRYAKTEIWHQEREKNKSDLARQRHEARLIRVEKQKAEVDARRKKKKAALKKPATDTQQDPKKAAIEAALARVKAQKAGTAPKNTRDLTDAQQQQIHAADARRQPANEDK